MLIGLTVVSPRKAPNVASIKRRPEDILCGIVLRSAQRWKTQQRLAWISPHDGPFFFFPLRPHIHDPHMAPKEVHRHPLQVHHHPPNLPKLSHTQVSFLDFKHTCLFMLISKLNIITCLVDRHFDGHAHKATLMLSLVMLLWWPKDGSLSRGIQYGCICMAGGDKPHQINDRNTHSLMEDGRESLLIRNMKMNKISDTLLGPSEQLQ